jgi:hypothetical protein
MVVIRRRRRASEHDRPPLTFRLDVADFDRDILPGRRAIRYRPEEVLSSIRHGSRAGQIRASLFVDERMALPATNMIRICIQSNW